MKTKGLEGKSNIGFQRGIHEPQGPWSGRMVKFFFGWGNVYKVLGPLILP